MALPALVVLAHADPTHLGRLLDRMAGCPAYVHIDARTPTAVHRQMAAAVPPGTVLLPRTTTTRCDFSLVETELAGLRAALARNDVEHVMVLSGADYPVVTTAALAAELDRWAGRSLLRSFRLPDQRWSTPRLRDGGLWRFTRPLLRWRGRPVHVGGTPVVLPGRRRVPADLCLHGASQWKVYSRTDAETLLAVCEERPDVVDFFRRSYIPDESFAATVLRSPALAGHDRLEDVTAGPWFIRWDQTDPGHPRTLTDDDLPALRIALRDAPSGAARSGVAPAGVPPGGAAPRPLPLLMARKLTTDVSSGLLDRIDQELLS